ncbi:nitroreductase/quinone reductase family protein [Streptomyces sp. NPDC058045]|uniref:nitroreductase/quinone reductase family protein n=1 Tax=Streptomyces sp. NPDC058045 TaxID=3346311 RepID=UPI0036E7A2C0
MNDDVHAALDIAPDASSRERTVDITTYGASSGEPRRIEIWFHHVDGRWFLSGSPGRRDWYANLLKDPRMVVHLKHGVTADVAARGVQITDPHEKRRLVTLILHGLERMGGWTTASAENIDAWTRGSPLVEIEFEENSTP